jgi:hypothetical protein
LSHFLQHFFAVTSWEARSEVLFEEEGAMSRYLVCLIFTTALFGLSPNATVLAQTNQQATEPDESTQSDEKSNEAASPDISDQTDENEDSDANQPGDESDQPADSDNAGSEDQDR